MIGLGAMVQEALVDALRHGLPVAGAVGGYAWKGRKSTKWYKTAGWALAGWGVGWLAQYLLLEVVLAPSKTLPHTSGTVAGHFAGGTTSTSAAEVEDEVRAHSRQEGPGGFVAPTGQGHGRNVSGTADAISITRVADTPYEANSKPRNGDHVQVQGSFAGGSVFGG